MLIWKQETITLSLLGSYILINYVIIIFSARKLKETNTVFFLPLLEIFLVLFQFAIFISNTISKPTHWK